MDENLENVENQETTQEETTPETKQTTNTEKMLPQSEVNKLIAREINQEKAKAKKLLESEQAKNAELIEKLSRYEATHASELEELKKDVDPDILEVIEDREVLYQIEWLKKYKKNDTKKKIDSTPKQTEEKHPVAKINRFM